MDRIKHYYNNLLRWLELTDRIDCATLTDSEIVANSKPLSCVKKIPTRPKSA